MHPNYENIAKLVCDYYNAKLSGNGKPKPNEWTVLAAIVQSTSQIPNYKVVSIATGTKCLGENEVSLTGELVSDSHAEVLARRAFLCYLYDQLNACVAGNSETIFKLTSKQPSAYRLLGHRYKTFELLESVEFHLFISELPCGDAGIFSSPTISSSSLPPSPDVYTTSLQPRLIINCEALSRDTNNTVDNLISTTVDSYLRELFGDPQPIVPNSEISSNSTSADFVILADTNQSSILNNNRYCPNNWITNQNQINNQNVSGAIVHRTGAKVRTSGHSGTSKYEKVQKTSVCRVKPGKGNPTLSMSCSDKIAKWQTLGLQGCLLSNFVPTPILLKSVIIGSDVPYEQSSIERALHERFYDQMPIPLIFQSKKHNFIKNLMSLKLTNSPAATSIIGYAKDEVSTHGKINPTCVQSVSVNGRKLGITKKNYSSPSARLPICRRVLFERFIKLLVSCYPDEKAEIYRGLYTYFAAKQLTRTNYKQKWKSLRSFLMKDWTDKPRCQIGFYNLIDYGVVNLPEGFVEGIEVQEEFAKHAAECSKAEEDFSLRKHFAEQNLFAKNELNELDFEQEVSELRSQYLDDHSKLDVREDLLELKGKIEKNKRENLLKLVDKKSRRFFKGSQTATARHLRSNHDLTSVPMIVEPELKTHFTPHSLQTIVALSSEEILEDVQAIEQVVPCDTSSEDTEVRTSTSSESKSDTTNNLDDSLEPVSCIPLKRKRGRKPGSSWYRDTAKHTKEVRKRITKVFLRRKLGRLWQVPSN